MLENLLQLEDLGLFVLRLVIGIIFIYHAIPKLKNPKGMSAMLGMPAMGPFILGAVESVSGAALIVGVWMQVAAILLALVMVGALYFKIVKWHVPFAAMDKTGWEFDLVLLAGTIVIMTSGGGTISFL